MLHKQCLFAGMLFPVKGHVPSLEPQHPSEVSIAIDCTLLFLVHGINISMSLWCLHLRIFTENPQYYIFTGLYPSFSSASILRLRSRPRTTFARPGCPHPDDIPWYTVQYIHIELT